MGRDALVAFRIFFYRLPGSTKPMELGLDPLEARFERRVAWLAPGGSALKLLLQRLDLFR